MTFSTKSPTAQQRRQYRQTNMLWLLAGAMMGFFASSFWTLTSCSEPVSSTAASRLWSTFAIKTTQHSKFVDKVSPYAKDIMSLGNDKGTNNDGWSTIHVFTGNNASHIVEASSISSQYYEQTRWFSQVRQDEVVSRLLRYKRGGYFIDLAANDAVRISNTYALERDYAWQGLCIEPNPVYWSGLAYRSCDVVAGVVGESRMEPVQFKFPNRAGPQGGIVGARFDNKEASSYGEDQTRFTVRLDEILKRFGAPSIIDYLSLDIEGAEEYVMREFPFDRYTIHVLTVERPDEALSSLLVQNGYKVLKQLKKWGETVWIHESAEDMIDRSALDIDTENYKYREKHAVTVN
jgi:hypothetical protein